VPASSSGHLSETCPACDDAHPATATPALSASAAATAAPAAHQPEARRFVLRRPVLTFALIGVNALVFAMMLLGGVPLMQPNSLQLIRWGADFGPLTLTGQWWRLLTSNYVHIGLLHLALNMWCLFDLGFLAENLYGRWTFFAVYLATGLSGSLASLVRNPVGVSAGASGAIFGVAGALITTLYLGDLPLARHTLKLSLRSLLLFAGYNLIYGFVKGGIDNGAHLGGLVSGLILGAVLSHDFQPSAAARPRLRPYLFPAAAAVLLLGAVGLRRANLPLILASNAEKSLARGNTGDAIAQLNRAIQLKPSAAAYSLLGNAYLMNKQDAPAEAAYNHALQLSPDDLDACRKLALLYAKNRRFDEAIAMYGKLTRMDPQDVSSFYDLGLVYKQLGRDQEAIAALAKAVALRPNFAPAQFNLGLLYMKAARYDDAIAAFQNVVRLLPNDPDAQLWLANAYQAKGMTAQASAAFQKAYSLRKPPPRRP